MFDLVRTRRERRAALAKRRMDEGGGAMTGAGYRAKRKREKVARASRKGNR